MMAAPQRPGGPGRPAGAGRGLVEQRGAIEERMRHGARWVVCRLEGFLDWTSPLTRSIFGPRSGERAWDPAAHGPPGPTHDDGGTAAGTAWHRPPQERARDAPAGAATAGFPVVLGVLVGIVVLALLVGGPHASPDPATAEQDILEVMHAYLAAEQVAAQTLDAAPLAAVMTPSSPLLAQRRAVLAERRAQGQVYHALVRAWDARVTLQGRMAWVSTRETWEITDGPNPAQRMQAQVRYLVTWSATDGWRIATATLDQVTPLP